MKNKNNFFVNISQGFGNKIFSIIVGLYIKYVNDANFYIRIKKSFHESNDDLSILEIFPKLKKYVNIVKDEINNIYKDYEIQHIHCNNISNLDDFKFKFENIILHVHGTSSCYRHIFEIYNKLPKEYSDVFEMNKKHITKEIQKLANSEYIAIHIRYGDKLNITYRHFYQFNKFPTRYAFLMYTPEYYKIIIAHYLKRNKKIYILSDDIKIVKEFICKDFMSNKNLFILDLPLFESFYILKNSYKLFMSVSTFSFLALLLNKKIKTAFYLKRPSELNKFTTPEEKYIKSDKIKFIYNRKYILNDNLNLIKKMISYQKYKYKKK